MPQKSGSICGGVRTGNHLVPSWTKASVAVVPKRRSSPHVDSFPGPRYALWHPGLYSVSYSVSLWGVVDVSGCPPDQVLGELKGIAEAVVEALAVQVDLAAVVAESVS